MSSVRSCGLTGRQPHTCHLYPSPVPGLPVDACVHLSVKGGLIFQRNCLANHTLKVIVGFLSAPSLRVTRTASVGETKYRKLTLIMCHHGQPNTESWERMAFSPLYSCLNASVDVLMRVVFPLIKLQNISSGLLLFV